MISLSNFGRHDNSYEYVPEEELPFTSNIHFIHSLIRKPVLPVFFAFLATVLLGINMNVVKYFDKDGFPADVFVYTCYGFTNFLQALFSLYYFLSFRFELNLFLYGFCGSLLNTLGLVCVALAVS